MGIEITCDQLRCRNQVDYDNVICDDHIEDMKTKEYEKGYAEAKAEFENPTT